MLAELMRTGTVPTEGHIDRLKRDAVRHKKAIECTHAQALDLIAAREGFMNWSLLMKCVNAARQQRRALA